jgi:uncharacterized protein (DUF1684 family)
MKGVVQRFGRRARLAFSLIVLALVGCNGAGGPATAYENEIIQTRLAKDVSFFNPETTILRPKELTKFTGLRYYPVDSTYKFVVPLRRLEKPDTVLIAKQRSGPIPYGHIGFVGIPGPDTTIELSVFWSEEMDPNKGWVPFNDPTNNVETYGGGRYLDIDIHPDGMATVDFNLAANPFCVYNAYDFNCAIPPASNRLTFPIRAGEKKALLLED